ncbi:winged helix-turn-helix domain-containing protein [Natronomonas sp. EA1]|uniref:winged helix-turn-helix domain-containing protein n=1 Tax=Natronomonas sp. EA1 TaxID=3421655 RepID=UPI003EB7C2D0
MDPHELRPADERILEYLGNNPPEYIPLIANRLGMPNGYAKRRCELLIDRGLMEPVTNEAIYRLTDRGARVLAGEKGAVRAADDA